VEDGRTGKGDDAYSYLVGMDTPACMDLITLFELSRAQIG
jgi:hypothetical protein